MSNRTFGATRNCAGCKFWSEMVARAVGGGPVEALCLAPTSSHSGAYTTSGVTCLAWESGENGAIDDPANDSDDELDELIDEQQFEASFKEIFG